MSISHREFFQLIDDFRKLNVGSILPPVIGYGEFGIMKTLKDFKEKYGETENIRVSALVEELEVPAPAVSRSLKSLEQKGYICRQVDIQDRRNTFVLLTDAGLALSNEIEEIMDAYANAVFERIGEESSELLKTYMKLLIQISADEITKRKYKDKANEKKLEKKGE